MTERKLDAAPVAFALTETAMLGILQRAMDEVFDDSGKKHWAEPPWKIYNDTLPQLARFLVYALAAHPKDEPEGPERIIPDDEIVGRGWVHIERMGDNHIWMNILGGSYDLHSHEGKITWTAQNGWNPLKL